MIPSHLLVKSFQPIIFIRKPRHTIRNLTLPNPFLSGATQFDWCDIPFDWCDVPFDWCDVPFSVENIIFNFSAKLVELSLFKRENPTQKLNLDEVLEWCDADHLVRRSVGFNGFKGHICRKNHKFRTKHVD